MVILTAAIGSLTNPSKHANTFLSKVFQVDVGVVDVVEKDKYGRQVCKRLEVKQKNRVNEVVIDPRNSEKTEKPCRIDAGTCIAYASTLKAKKKL